MSSHADWVQSATGKKLSEIGEAAIEIVCAAFRCGPWNVITNWNNATLDDSYYAEIVVSREMATFDHDHLTGLVIVSHDRMVRTSVTGCAPGRLRLLFHQRKGRSGCISQRHPTIEDAVNYRRGRGDV